MSEQRKPTAATAAIPAKPGVNPFDALDTPAAPEGSNPFDALDAERTSMMDAFWHGMAHGAVSTLQGTGQLAAHLGRSLGLVDDKFVERSDAEAEQYQGAYEQQHEVQVHPWAAKAGEVAGQMGASAPLMLLPGMGQATVLGRLASGVALGTVEGILQPVTDEGEEDFYTQKAWQGLQGAGGGAAGVGAGELAGSVLSRFIARGDKGTAAMFRTAVKPSSRGVTSQAVLSKQDQRIMTAIDQVIANRPNLKLTDEAGNVVTGQLPKSLKQFSEALDQTKRSVFAKYDGMLKQVGYLADPIDLKPIADQVRKYATGSFTKTMRPGVGKQAEALADRLEARGGISLAEAQDWVTEINKGTQGFWRKEAGKAEVSLDTVEADVATMLRRSLDSTINKLQGPLQGQGAGYQELRNTYGALRDIEENVVKAVVREHGKRRGGVGDFLKSVVGSTHVALGVLTLHPGVVYRGVTVAAGKAWMKHLNDPNRAIERLFDYRSTVMRQNTSKLLQAVRDAEPVARRRITQLSGAAGGAQAARQDTLTMVEP